MALKNEEKTFQSKQIIEQPWGRGIKTDDTVQRKQNRNP